MGMGCAAAQIGNGAVQQGGKLLLFFRGEALHDSVFRCADDLVHGVVTFLPFGKDVDPFAPAVVGIGTELDEALLLQTGEKSGYSGMAQVEDFFHIPRTWWLRLSGQISHNVSLSGSQFHIFQRPGHDLVDTPMEDPQQIAVVDLQSDHLLKM